MRYAESQKFVNDCRTGGKPRADAILLERRTAGHGSDVEQARLGETWGAEEDWHVCRGALDA